MFAETTLHATAYVKGCKGIAYYTRFNALK